MFASRPSLGLAATAAVDDDVKDMRTIDDDTDDEIAHMDREVYGELQLTLQVLLTDIIIANIVSYLSPTDSVELLFICKATYESHTLSYILLKLLKLEEYHQSELSRSLGFTSENPRQLVAHAVRKLGYNCVVCYTPLDGPAGLFACTNTCANCAHEKFKSQGAGYVDGLVRFYLCGNDSITTRGQAFLVHPYWIGLDNAYEGVLQQYGGAFRLAQAIYDEKKFFQEFAPANITRPRDDKSLTIRRMIEQEEEEARLSASSGLNCSYASRLSPVGSSSDTLLSDYGSEIESMTSTLPARGSSSRAPLPAPNLVSEKMLQPAAMQSHMSAQPSGRNLSLIIPEGSDSPSSKHMQSADAMDTDTTSAPAQTPDCGEGFHWSQMVPSTLREVYEAERRRYQEGLEPRSPLQTHPLRELVKTLHSKAGVPLRFFQTPSSSSSSSSAGSNSTAHSSHIA